MLEFLRSLTPLPEDGWWRQSSFIGHFQLLAERAPGAGDGSVEGFIARVAPNPAIHRQERWRIRSSYLVRQYRNIGNIVWCSHRGFFAANERKPTQIGQDRLTIIDGSLSINA